ncbi:retrotransposable element [Pimephales promelas]|nr:retrotransposable element [Pimephales promelas]KAG1952092.1 retrotransposable element [Pimephales promelas]
MNPAEGHSFQAAVEIQGAMLGRHEEELSAARRTVETLASQVDDLTKQLHYLRRDLSHSADIPEPRPLTCAKDHARIAYIISLLKGWAREWGTAVWSSEADFLNHYALFKEEMLKVFDRSVHGPEASRLLSSLRQGRRSVADFSVEFRTLSTSCGWNEPALVARFIEGLDAEIRDKVLARESPSHLVSLIDLALRVEKRFELRRRARCTTAAASSPSAVSVTSSSVTDQEPMQLGVKSQPSPVERGLLVSASSLHPPRPSRTTFPVRLHWLNSTASGQALIDSGSEGNFVDETWALQHKIPLVDLQKTTTVFALDRRVLAREEPGDLSGVPEEYVDLRAVFSRSRAASLPPHRPYDCSIDLLPGSTPPRGRLYSLSIPEREALEKYLSESLNADYQVLNYITIKNRYPLPLMSSAFEILQGAQFFTKLDLRNAYHLVRIKAGDEWKTAFNTPLGHFEYRVLPFGLVNAPAVFQALVNDVLRDMLNIFVFVYLDDILIFSPSLQVHVQHVRQVLQRLLENKLFVKAEKCTFHARSVTFLGSVIYAQGISMDLNKVCAVTEWPTPDSRVSLQRFLGFANFYRRFIRNFSQVEAPLTALTSTKTRFCWSDSAQASFDSLKSLFSSAPILITPDVSRQFIVEVDASEVGVGAILSQRSPADERIHPCAFFSHRLSPSERNYDVGNRKLLAIRLALGEWRHWLEGSSVPFVVWTDHRNLEYLRTAKRFNARQARWSLFFARFDFTISCRPGPKNLKPDALSCQFAPSEPKPSDERILPQGVVVVGAAVWGLERIVKRALAHSVTPRLCPRGLLFVPPPARRAVLQWGHSSRIFAHPGVRGTIASISQRFWWPTLERDIRRFIASCSVCAQTKVSNKPPAGLLRPLPIPFHPQTNGQAEHANQTIGRILRSLVFRNPASWSEQLPWAEYAHNSAPSSATGLSPFECCLGYQPPLFPSASSESNVPSVNTFIQRCKRTWRAVRSALCKSRSVTRRAANKRRVKSPRYVCGQRVWLSTLNLPLQFPSRKLAPKFIGPLLSASRAPLSIESADSLTFVPEVGVGSFG